MNIGDRIYILNHIENFHNKIGQTSWVSHPYLDPNLKKLIIDVFVTSLFRRNINDFRFYFGTIKDKNFNMIFVKFEKEIDHAKCIEIYDKLLILR